MGKVISAEIKKILSKPGIYILSVLLAIILVLGAFIYKPTIYEDTSTSLVGNTFMEKYTNFVGDDSTSKTWGIKVKTDESVKNSIKSISNYYISTDFGYVSFKVYIENLLVKFNEKYKAFRDYASNDNNNQNDINAARNEITVVLDELDSTIESALLSADINAYPIIVTNKNYETYKSIHKDVLAWSKISVLKADIHTHCKQYEEKYKDKFLDVLKTFKYPTLETSFVNSYTTTGTTKLSTLYTRLNNIIKEIEEYKSKVENDTTTIEAEKLNNTLSHKMDKLANKYINTASTYTNLIKYELISNAFSITNTNEQLDLKFLSTKSQYNTNSLVIRYNYLFENDKIEDDYAHPLTIGITSNHQINTYDYAYFVLRLFSFVIIVYAVMAACHTIAGEIKEGSMRYFAIRPVTRSNIYFGKILAILIMSIILIIFSTVIAIAVGGAVYGFETSNILTIFNSSTAIVLHPIAMLGVYILSLVLELCIYMSIAMLLSVLIKSDLLSVTLLLVLYLINILLPMFVQGTNTWLTFYPFSHISLYALFGSSVYAIPSNFYNLLLGTKVYSATNLWLTLSIILLSIIVINVIASRIFKHKEL